MRFEEVQQQAVVDCEQVKKHMVTCEMTIEKLFGNAPQSLGEVGLRIVRDLNDCNTAMINSVFGDKEFQVSPKLPFTKDEVLEKLRFYQRQFEKMIPRVEGPRL
jgi:hypothetical protein